MVSVRTRSGEKVGRNDPCWCGSGRKFKHCHLVRSEEAKLPFPAIVSKVREGSELRVCLHPDAPESCDRVVSAHTLQRARVLQQMTDRDNHVLTFFPPNPGPDGLLTLQRRGWRQASTFAAFCAKHDARTFAPLENADYLGTKEQAFLAAYRAICWELYQKTRAVKSRPVARDILDRGAPEFLQQIAQELLGVQDAGFRKGLSSLQATKAEMDGALRARDYSAFEAYEVTLEGPVGIAATGAITPNRTLKGTALQILHDTKARLEWLAFGIDIGPCGVSLTFFWQRRDAAAGNYIEEIHGLKDQHLPEFLVQFLSLIAKIHTLQAHGGKG